jgi:hypothetical protein
MAILLLLLQMRVQAVTHPQSYLVNPQPEEVRDVRFHACPCAVPEEIHQRKAADNLQQVPGDASCD